MGENVSLAEKTVLRYVIKNLKRSIERRDKKSLKNLWENLNDITAQKYSFNVPYLEEREELDELNDRIKELFGLLGPSNDFPEYRRLNSEERKKEALRCASGIESIIVNKLGISKKETLAERKSRTKGGITLEIRQRLEDEMKLLKLGVEQKNPNTFSAPIVGIPVTLYHAKQEVTGYASEKWIGETERLFDELTRANDIYHYNSAFYKKMRSLLVQLEGLLKRFGLDISIKKIALVPASKLMIKDGHIILYDELIPRKGWYRKKP